MHEQRIISFRESELADALAIYRSKSNYAPMEFDRLQVVQRNDQPIVECWDQTQAAKHSYYDHEVCSALMLYCIDRNVPLPRRASKAVYMNGDGVKLVISMGQL